MLSGNRLHNLALRGLIAAIIIAAGVSYSADVTQKPAAEANQGQKAAQDKSATSPLFVPTDKQVSAASDKADYYAKADLDAQERMAAEAEHLAKLTDSQLTVSIVEAVLLGLTLFAAVVAAGAAIKGAIAAEEVVRETRRIGEAQVRAYVSITNIEGRFYNSGIDIKAFYKNTGQTPTKNLRITASGDCQSGLSYLARPINRLAKKFPHNIAAQDGREIEHRIDFDQERCPPPYFLVVDIRVQFEDVFDRKIDNTTRYWGLMGPLRILSDFTTLEPMLPNDPEA